MLIKSRRFFIKCLAALPVIVTPLACSEKEKPMETSRRIALKRDPSAMELSRKMSREQVYAMLDQRAVLAMEKSHNCAQSTFFVLAEQFGLGGDDVLKALTPMPGVAERGETCGAITGALMAMGLIYGRDNLEDWESYRNSLIPTNSFVQKFEEELGSTLCCNIQRSAFGKSYNLMNPDDLKAFQKAGATQKCTRVVQKAARIAAGIILDEPEKT